MFKTLKQEEVLQTQEIYNQKSRNPNPKLDSERLFGIQGDGPKSLSCKHEDLSSNPQHLWLQIPLYWVLWGGGEDRRILETHWLVSEKGKCLIQWRLSLVNMVESNQGRNTLSSGSLCMHAYRHRHLHIHAHTTHECTHTLTHIHTHIQITHSYIHIYTCTLPHTTHIHTPTHPFK